MRLRLMRALPIALVLLLALAAGSAGAQAPVATGLDNPRGLAFGPDGTLYIAEAGRGGTAPCYVTGDGAENCVGPTGAVTEVRRGVQRRLVSGLPSAAEAGGGGATGPHDVSLLGNGNIVVSLGLGADPALAAPGGPLAGTGLGSLIRLMGRSGKWKSVADIGAYEASANPDGGAHDTNPYGVLATSRGTYVADAGGNSLLRVSSSGRISTVAVFPDRLAPAPPFLGLPPGAQIPAQAVPTAVAEGPDGALYVSQLTGFPFPVGGSTIWRIGAAGPTAYLTGFTNVVDLAFGSDGSLYVVELASAGLLAGLDGTVIRVSPSGERSPVATGLFAPGGIAIGPDHAAYVTVCSVCPRGGAVLRFPQ